MRAGRKETEMKRGGMMKRGYTYINIYISISTAFIRMRTEI